VKVIFRDAGHILGSASVVMEINDAGAENIRLGFSGDIGRPARPILRDPIPMVPVDYLLCESTYGGKEHHGQPHDEEALLQIITKTCVEQKGKLLIPAFSVGRTQELVYMMDRLETHGKLPNIPVYVDSPLAVNATELFIMHPECYDEEILDYMLEDPHPFGFSRLHFIKDRDGSKQLNHVEGPCVIISASGMMQAGRIKHHLYHNIEDSRNTILVVGHVSDGTLGAEIRDRRETVRIFGKEMQLNASVEIMDSFSAHADHSEIMDFLGHQDREKLKKIFLVHGPPSRQEVLKTAMLSEGFKEVVIPQFGESVGLT
jgi:metallo-beta-lactamase family protein